MAVVGYRSEAIEAKVVRLGADPDRTRKLFNSRTFRATQRVLMLSLNLADSGRGGPVVAGVARRVARGADRVSNMLPVARKASPADKHVAFVAISRQARSRN